MGLYHSLASSPGQWDCSLPVYGSSVVTFFDATSLPNTCYPFMWHTLNITSHPLSSRMRPRCRYSLNMFGDDSRVSILGFEEHHTNSRKLHSLFSTFIAHTKVTDLGAHRIPLPVLYAFSLLYCVSHRLNTYEYCNWHKPIRSRLLRLRTNTLITINAGTQQLDQTHLTYLLLRTIPPFTPYG